jgi:hypothetical protein
VSVFISSLQRSSVAAALWAAKDDAVPQKALAKKNAAKGHALCRI